MQEEGYVFVQVTRTYLLTAQQAKKAVRVARALSAEEIHYSSDPDGTQFEIQGNDYLMPNGRPDPAAAIADMPSLTEAIEVEETSVSSKILSNEEVMEVTQLWPENWRENRLGPDADD
ncbi:hypothetical protein ACFMBG_16970 [Leisingera sp. D0M16]|uniref:hypothetical protein n=1 Tax=Leisingera coralii TaxID=3351347 RepID=UPI003B75EB09